jgi:hypothetical protein
MALPVSLDLVVDELESLSPGMLAYVHRQTGELITLTEEMQELAEREDPDDDDVDDWWGDDLPVDKLREIVDSGDWMALPDPFAIHEWEIMRAFADTVADERRSEELHGALRGRGAFRRFKDVLSRYGLQEPWLTFKRKAIEQIARDALEGAGIPFT